MSVFGGASLLGVGSENVAISAAVEEKGGSLPGLTAERGPLLGLWPRPLLLTQGADSKIERALVSHLHK